MKLFFSLFFLFSVVFLSSCKQTSTDTTNTELTADTQALSEALSAGGTGINSPSVPSSRAACSTLTFGSCSSLTRTRSFSTSGGDTNPCTRGVLDVFGQSILSFSAASCAFSTNNDTITRTLNNHYVEGPLGNKIVMYTAAGTVAGKTIAAADLKDYGGTTRSGGSVLTKGTPNTLDITGIHRRGLTAGGIFTFWHTIYTGSGSPLTLVEAGSGPSLTVTVNGTLLIAHNIVQVLVTKTLTNLVFVPGCHFPTSGTETISIPTASGTTTVDVTYSSTCGTATINGATVDLDG